ncbi:MAG: hypothetical protein GX759_06420 [Thermoanaerobacterales bacterium]|nr:hypothetical protein [Thermoanaerobacterales bacterium]
MSINLSETEKEIVKFVMENPYTEKKAILEALEGKPDVGSSLDKLANSLVLVELTGPMESSLESRVPKKIYMVNPEKESELQI